MSRRSASSGPTTSNFGGEAEKSQPQANATGVAIIRQRAMNDTEIAELKVAVERAHRSPATYRTYERVREQQREFEVAIFDILGHPRALVCYAWFTAVEGSRPRAFTVLREGPIHTSLDAVRFAMEDTAH
jgi:hypothetical protein